MINNFAFFLVDCFDNLLLYVFALAPGNIFTNFLAMILARFSWNIVTNLLLNIGTRLRRNINTPLLDNIIALLPGYVLHSSEGTLWHLDCCTTWQTSFLPPSPSSSSQHFSTSSVHTSSKICLHTLSEVSVQVVSFTSEHWLFQTC